MGLLHTADHQLRDSVSAVNLVGGSRIGVHKYDCDLAPVTRVDQAGRVQAGDPVLGCKATSRQDKARVADGDLERDPGRDYRAPTACCQHGVASGDQVASGIAGPGVAR